MATTPTPEQARRLAVTLTFSVVLINAAFFFLSQAWGSDRVDADLGGIRISFGITSTLVGASTYFAMIKPREVGHTLALLVGLTSLAAGIMAFAHDLPNVMGATLLVVGVLLWVLAYRSWFRQSRASWAFMVALLATFAAVDFFGAPKVRSLIGIGLWTALLAPGLQVVAVIALARCRDEYRDA